MTTDVPECVSRLGYSYGRSVKGLKDLKKDLDWVSERLSVSLDGKGSVHFSQTEPCFGEFPSDFKSQRTLFSSQDRSSSRINQNFLLDDQLQKEKEKKIKLLLYDNSHLTSYFGFLNKINCFCMQQNMCGPFTIRVNSEYWDTPPWKRQKERILLL